MKRLIVIPTYNEKTNITILIKKLIKLYKSKFQILIIDDNSPDGTSAEVLKLKNFLVDLNIACRLLEEYSWEKNTTSIWLDRG